MDNKNHEAQSTASTTPIPDLFNTELEAMPEKANEAHPCNKPNDISDCTDNTEEPVRLDVENDVTVDSEAEIKKFEEPKLLNDEIAVLSERILSLEKLFNTKIMHSEHEKKIVDQMHRELQKYKDDMYAQLIRPILLDVISMRDSLIKQLKEHRGKPEGEQQISLQMFETYAFDAEEILERNNIEIYKSEINSDFVPLRQRAIKKVFTDDQSLHGKVAESIIDGYSYQGKAIAPEKVAVYVYEPKQELKKADNNGEESQNG